MNSKTNLISIYAHHPDAKPFERMLKNLHGKGFRFVDLHEMLAWYNDSGAFDREKLCFVSLDDGFASNELLVDACERFHAPLTIFVATRPLIVGNFWWRYVYALAKEESAIGKAMKLPYLDFCQLVTEAEKKYPLTRVALTQEQVTKMSKHPLITFGSHTITHSILPQMPDEVLEHELVESKRIIEELTSKPCDAFSYPNGSLTKRDVEAVRRYYKVAFTTEQRNPNPNDDLALVPRIGVTCSPIRDQLKLWGIWPWLKKVYETVH